MIMTTLLRFPVVMQRTGFARSTVYLHMHQGEFPRPVRIGDTSVAWIEEETEAWIQARIRESRPAPGRIA
jgi:prophage regulatory protein